MYKKYFLLALSFLVFFSCKKEMHVSKIEGKRIEINDSINGVSEIEEFIKPYREHVNKNLDSVISYSVDTFTKKDGELNTAIGNMFADAVIEQCSPIFEKQTGNKIDMVLLNHGGIRSILSKGDVTTRTAYQIMPFENTTVVVEMNGEAIQDLITYLQKAKRAHPISGLSLILDSENNVKEAKINGNAIESDKIYYVATNDYLYNGGDRMNFFKKGTTVHDINYKLRNVLIDYFHKKDTLNPQIDNRFIKQ